ncbi:MAG: ubiquinone biosynthesis protein UbiA, partial [Daejeonella sp.]
GQGQNFCIFLLFALPVFAVFIRWFVKVWYDESQADFKNMSRMTMLSGLMMLMYFILLNLI